MMCGFGSFHIIHNKNNLNDTWKEDQLLEDIVLGVSCFFFHVSGQLHTKPKKSRQQYLENKAGYD